MKIIETEIPEVKLVEPSVFSDSRGFFVVNYHAEDFKKGGITDVFVQDNHSRSQQGTLRGLHRQTGAHQQAKLVRCTQGEIFDVAIDIRRDSPTFGKWVSRILSATNNHMLYIPGDFLHGFYVLSKTAEVQYKCSNLYSPKHEAGFRWDDPTFNIDWPLINGIDTVLSEKDSIAPLFK
jgi:dTDP-4-dehydrorhamnose 3,5-epimerase